ncbi:MAG: hypothetical protein EOP85_00360 [Verrucomicrobiaceae bacterium]|nr:MAG: hypothetical protein EOP85_00360 [Verrucomicrobiaceae bacterium]
MAEITHYETRLKLLALAETWHVADEETRARLRTRADFFPISRGDEIDYPLRSLVIRVGGQIFLIEDTCGGEKGVFALLLPVI